ncbi:hypothetical protein [Roseateles sp. BYS87W]|uniref:Solute-binding protein family 3/N-terminal domain-containing protein n=1 Tax=Pelomonas baiyunensis TaxID=3299026 RepID=A0ABW7GTH4_9BURK
MPVSLGAPLAEWDEQQQLRGGLVVQLARHVASSRGLALELLPLPPARLRNEAAAGNFDAVCLPEAQRGPERDLLDWAPPAFELNALLLAHVTSPRLERMADLPADAVVGHVQGTNLAALDPGLADPRVRHEDALSEDRLARKLLSRRHPYAVMSQPAASHWRAQSPDVAAWALPLEKTALVCGLARRGPLSAGQWAEAQDQARRQGLLPQWMHDARMPGFAMVVSRQHEAAPLTEQQLNDLFLARRGGTANGGPLRLLMLGGAWRADAIRQLLQREPGEYTAQWSGQQFGGRRRAPEEFDDPVQLRAALRQDPRALGVLPWWAVDASVRVLNFR